jgi:tetratricopeptide (TPR) repeat protein
MSNSVNPRELSDSISELIVAEDFQRAEQVILDAQRKADAQGDAEIKHLVLSELIELYCIWDPPLWSKAEALSEKREQLVHSAYSKLQTAMILHRGVHDYQRAIKKLEEAVSDGRAERDDKTVYTSLSLLGQTHLELGKNDEALAVLSQIEEMVERKASVVVGDETCFLERLRLQSLETERVARLASILSSACRDRDFKERLRALAVPL